MEGDEEIDIFVKKLSTIFSITDIARTRYFLAIKLDVQKHDVFLSESAYLQRIIDIANMITAKASKYPLPLSHILYHIIDEPKSEQQ